jgi:hypothetical protein
MRERGMFSAALTAVLTLGLAGPLAAVDFIRGDANDDGRVTVSDAWFLVKGLYQGGQGPSCLASADANRDGNLDTSDAVSLLSHLFLGGPAPAAPFPDPGPWTEEEKLPCAATGLGGPLADPKARLEVAEALAAGGGSRMAALEVRFTSLLPIGAFSLRIRDDAGVIENLAPSSAGCEPPIEALFPLDLPWWFLEGYVRDGGFDLGGVATFMTPRTVPRGDGTPLCAVRLCLKPGAMAGTYPLVVEAGELSSEDGRAIVTSLGDGVLTVLADIEASAACDPCPPEVIIAVAFKLGSAAAEPGGELALPFLVRSDRPVTGLSWSIDLDERYLEPLGQEAVWARPGGEPFDFQTYDMDGRDINPGSGGVDEGFFSGSIVIAASEAGGVLPVDEDVEVVRLMLRARSGVLGPTEIRFMDGARLSGNPVRNSVIYGGSEVGRAEARSFGLVAGAVTIAPPEALFVRGDTTGEGDVDLSDPIRILEFLFLSGEAPSCLDAADANDDGAVDLSDPIRILSSLFLGEGPLPPPAGEPGPDPTADGLGCG